MLDLQTAFSIHAKGHAKLTRRMVVHIADDCAMNVREAVLAMERKGFAKDGSWDWFKANGGITSDQIDAVRADRNSTNQDQYLCTVHFAGQTPMNMLMSDWAVKASP